MHASLCSLHCQPAHENGVRVYILGNMCEVHRALYVRYIKTHLYYYYSLDQSIAFLTLNILRIFGFSEICAQPPALSRLFSNPDFGTAG